MSTRASRLRLTEPRPSISVPELRFRHLPCSGQCCRPLPSTRLPGANLVSGPATRRDASWECLHKKSLNSMTLQTLVPPLRRGRLKTGQRIPIKHIMPEDGFANFKDPIPLFVSGFGPRSLVLRALTRCGVSTQSAVRQSLAAVHEGARASNRTAGTRRQRNDLTTQLTA